MAKAKAPAAELLAACQGVPDAQATAAGSSGRAADMLAVFVAFQREVEGLAASGAPAWQLLAACDRYVCGGGPWRMGERFGCEQGLGLGCVQEGTPVASRLLG